MNFLEQTWWMIFSPCLLVAWPIILAVLIGTVLSALAMLILEEMDEVEATKFIALTWILVAGLSTFWTLIGYAAGDCRWP